MHGRTSATTTGTGRLVSAEVHLPVKVTINIPRAVREAGPGVLEVIAAHELAHALGDEPRYSHLMSQTWYKDAGDTTAGDRLKVGSARMPPLALSEGSVAPLKSIWS